MATRPRAEHPKYSIDVRGQKLERRPFYQLV